MPTSFVSVSKRKSRYVPFFEGGTEVKGSGAIPLVPRMENWTIIPSNIPLPSGLVKSGEALRYKRLDYLRIQFSNKEYNV